MGFELVTKIDSAQMVRMPACTGPQERPTKSADGSMAERWLETIPGQRQPALDWCWLARSSTTTGNAVSPAGRSALHHHRDKGIPGGYTPGPLYLQETPRETATWPLLEGVGIVHAMPLWEIFPSQFTAGGKKAVAHEGA